MADSEGVIGKTYAEGRARITELVQGLDDEQARTPVPACPEWTVHDVVAHLTGVCSDIVSGNLDGVATEPWTAAQVAARRDADMQALVDEWSTTAPQVEAIADAFGAAGAQLIADLTSHEHDLRAALAAPGARDSEGVRIGLDFVVGAMDQSMKAHGLPAIEVRAGDERWTVGEGKPAGTLEVEPFELLRAATGRRSAAQIATLGWSVDPERYVAAFTFGPFTAPATDLDE